MKTDASADLGAETPYLLEPDGGERLRFLGDSSMRLKHDTGADGPIAFYEYTCGPAAAGAPQHIHHGHDETFYIVDGVFEFAIAADVTLLQPGSFLYVPRGTPHGFRNASDATGRMVGTFNPARFAHYFRELAALIAQTDTPPDRDTWATLYSRYDTTFYDQHSP